MTEQKKYGYTVDIDSHCHDSYYSGEQFGDWHESWSHYFKRVYRTPENAYSSISSHLDLVRGTPVFVVWVEYSTGDSFGYASHREAEIVAILTDHEDATGLETYLNDSNQSAYEGKYTLKDGNLITFYKSWTGYFETLENVHVEATLLQ